MEKDNSERWYTPRISIMIKLQLKFDQDREEFKVHLGYGRILRETMQISHEIVVQGSRKINKDFQQKGYEDVHSN